MPDPRGQQSYNFFNDCAGGGPGVAFRSIRVKPTSLPMGWREYSSMNTNEVAEQATERAKATAGKVKGAARDLTEKARSKARDASAAADLYLHEYAWTTTALVAVTAGLVGYLLGRRRM
jgi:ElaB/YqjD/DUF883 family membrane-anchored ribosome-binding protein